MLFCEKCGQQIEDESKFCKYCGTVVKKIEQEKSKNQEDNNNNNNNNNRFIDTLLTFLKKHWFGTSLAVELIILFGFIIYFICSTIHVWGTVALVVLAVIAYALFMILIVFIANEEERKKIKEKCKLIKEAFKELGYRIKKTFNQNKEENEIAILFFAGMIDFFIIFFIIVLKFGA